MTPGRIVRHAATALAMLALFAAWWVTIRPSALGGPLSAVVVRGQSMEPGWSSGDLVFFHQPRGSAQPGAYAVGERIAYRLSTGHVVIHRVTEVVPDGYRTKGDNLPAVDLWRPAPTDVIGRSVLTLPGMEIWARRALQPTGMATLAALIAMATALYLSAGSFQPRGKYALRERASAGLHGLAVMELNDRTRPIAAVLALQLGLLTSAAVVAFAASLILTTADAGVWTKTAPIGGFLPNIPYVLNLL